MKSEDEILIVDVLKGSGKVLAAYCFGERICRVDVRHPLVDGGSTVCRKRHYYLFVVAKDFRPESAGNMSAQVKHNSGGDCTVTVVLQSKKSLKQRNGEPQYFFNAVVTLGRLLYQDGHGIYLPNDQVPVRDLVSLKRYLKQRENARTFYMESEMMDGGASTLIHVYMMRCAVEQSCLALIKVFLGYEPNQFSLRFLLELCGYFIVMPDEVFPRTSETDRRLLKVLACQNQSLRTGRVDDVAPYDVEVLRGRCGEFVRRSGVLVQAELDRLANL